MNEPSFKARELMCIVRPVHDLSVARAFYCDALGFRLVETGDVGLSVSPWRAALGIAWGCEIRKHLVLAAGDQRLVLLAARPSSPTMLDTGAADPRFQHIAVVVTDVAAAWQHLVDACPGVRLIGDGGPQRLPPSAGGVTAVKFRDPSGNPVELIAFPSNATPARWESVVCTDGATASAAPLGIDHSAITVSSADASIVFYQRQLGLQMSHHQTNRGAEQGRLDGLEAPVVEVVALHPAAAESPHLELLAYLHPSSDRSDSESTNSNVAPAHSSAFPRTALVWRGARSAGDKAALPTDEVATTWIDDPDGHLHLLVPQVDRPMVGTGVQR